MAINLKFDLMGNPEPPSIVLANRNGNKLGQLDVNVESIDVKDLLETSEFTFTLNKYVDGKLTNLWDKVLDFKLVYCPEWDLWYEIKVELDEATETVKTVFCTQLGQAELSQIIVYNIEINTETDIARDDYKISILYDENNSDASILHRVMSKAPHYSIAYVDESLKRIQRSFSFDDASICDVFDEIEEEVGCLVVYNSNSDKNGMPKRDVSIYDLCQHCADCGYREEFIGDECPKCHSKNIVDGYGEDTTIFVTADELATEGIQLVTDTDSVKNCFKLEAGDDLMTATIRNCNPNGSDYIWYFSDAVKEDMSNELVEAIESYDSKYKEYYESHISNLDASLVRKYNALVEKYKEYYNTPSTCINCDYKGEFENECPSCHSGNILTGKSLQSVDTPITGYPALMNAYYNIIDLALYLESGLMPNVEMSDTKAEEQVKLLTTSSLSPVAVNVEKMDNISLATANSAVLSMAKVIVRPTYKVEISSSTLSNDKVWRGQFIVTNYSDETDTAISDTVNVAINNKTEDFIKQKIEKALNKENTDDLSISGLFDEDKYDYDTFCVELKKYALNPLKSFYDACDACLNILTEQGAGDKDEKLDLYENLYKPYYKKSQAIANEIKIREDEIAVIKGSYDETDEDNKVLITEGLQINIEGCRKEIQDALNFEEHLGKDLWLEFCAYRREDKYSNSNYVSDGLNNAELFEKANEFIKVAEQEIFKSAELQHSISATLNNLLAIPKFQPLVKYFKTGNWIRVQIDDKIFKLRLLEYDFSYSDLQSVPVEFSDVTKIKSGTTDVKDIISQAASMASSYDSVQRQAKKGDVARSTIDQWLVDGLNSANVEIKNNNSEEVIITKNGLLARSYSDITGEYSPEQLKITHNIMAYTDDNWETVSSALGRHEYKYWNGTSFVDAVDYGLTSKFVIAGYITSSQIVSGEIVSSNYEPRARGTYFNLNNGDFEIAGGNIVYDADDKSLTLKGVTIEWDTANAPEVKDISGLSEYLDQLEDLEDQLDGRVQTYSQSEDPSKSWTEDEYANHIGDLWLNPDNGLTKRWTGTEWIEVTDSDLKKLAESKARIFTVTPTPPYYIGDLWVQGSAGDILHCIASKAEGQSYSVNDWELSSKYTDDTVAKEALESAKQGIKDASEGISLANAAQTSANSAYTRAEEAETNAKGYADTQDANVLSNANNYADSKDNSLSNTLTSAYQNYTDSEIKKLDDAVSTYLGWDGKTIIDDKYVISPYLGGGYLNITGVNNKLRVVIDPNDLTGNGYVFQVHNGDSDRVIMGVDSDGNASFNGAIIATSLTLGDGVAISTDDIDGLDKYAKTEDIPTIPENIIYTDDVSISSSTSSNGVTTQSITVGDNTYTSIISGDFVITDIGLGTNTEDGSKRYTCISKDGLLTAKNAIIYGTIYATAGQFTGDIIANSLKLGNDVKISTDNVGGLSKVATSGDYNDLSGNPDLSIYATTDNLSDYVTNSSLSSQLASYATTGQLSDYLKTNDLNSKLGDLNVSYRGDVQTSQTTDSETGIIATTSTYISADGTKHTTTTYTTEASDYVLLSRNNQWGTGDTLVKISKEGLLEAKNAVISGTIYATDGEFTGDIIANSLTLGSDMKIGDDENGFHTWISTEGVLNANGANITGIINAANGSIGGWSIDSDRIYKDDFQISVGDTQVNSLVSEGLLSAQRIAVGGSTGNSYTHHGSFAKVDNDGNFTFSFYYEGTDIPYDVVIKSIESDSSGESISLDYLISYQCDIADSTKSQAVISGVFDYEYVSNDSVWISFDYKNNNKQTFQLLADGSLYATNAEIKGTIYADDGQIGGWCIDSTSLHTDDKSLYFGSSGISATIGDDSLNNIVFKAGNKFGVQNDGSLYATNANISGLIYTKGEHYYSEIQNQPYPTSVTMNDGKLICNIDNKIYQNYAELNARGLKFYRTDVDIVDNGLFEIWGNGSGLPDENGQIPWDSYEIKAQRLCLKSSIATGQLIGTWTSENDLSDERVKNTIELLPETYDILFDNLLPKRYKYNHGTSDRFHTGYVAQDVVNAIGVAGLTTQDFAGVMLSDPNTEQERWYLRRDEFIALNTWQIQKLKARVAKLEAKLESLELLQ